MRIAALIMLVFPLSVQAQVDYPTRDALMEAFKDADFAFRRFEEAAAQVKLDRYQLPEETREDAIKVLRNTRAEVAKAKRIVSRLERSQEPFTFTSVALLTVYDALGSSGHELYYLAEFALRWQDKSLPEMAQALRAGDLSQELERASGTVLLSQTNFHAVLLQQLIAEEFELGRCRTKGRQDITPK